MIINKLSPIFSVFKECGEKIWKENIKRNKE